MPDSLGHPRRKNRQHWFGPSSATSKGAGHPVMFGFPTPAQHFVAMVDGGGYPLGFVEWAYREVARLRGRAVDAEAVVHLCSGSMRTGIRVDIRPEMEPTIVADCREVPLPDESADLILADPPYSEDYATNLYGTGKAYPKPGEIVREATRLLRPGGYFGLLHFQVPIIKYPLEMVNVYGISTGMGFAIRAWTLMQKRESGLLEMMS